MLLLKSNVSVQTWSRELDHSPLLVGRGDDVDIRLNDETVSRKHCRFTIENDVCWLEDCGSRNGTWVNGESVSRVQLQPDDRLLIGKFELLVVDDAEGITTGEYFLDTSDFEDSDRQTALATRQFSENFDWPNEECRLAALVHQQLNPSEQISLPGLLIDVAYVPSGALGGDCFLCLQVDDCWILAVFDPLSHGTKAALMITLLRSQLENWMEFESDPGSCLRRINQQMVEFNIEDLYVSACVALWRPASRSIVYSTAGLHPPMISRDGEMHIATEFANGLPLGVSTDEKFSSRKVALEQGDRVFLFTDGVGDLLRHQGHAGSTVRCIADALTLVRHGRLRPVFQNLLFGNKTPPQDDSLLVGCEVL